MSECILVADDDREIVKAIAILLEREGYKVLRAYDGLEALDLLAQNQVQLILMDVIFPPSMRAQPSGQWRRKVN